MTILRAIIHKLFPRLRVKRNINARMRAEKIAERLNAESSARMKAILE